jgi:hypothetical protein
MPGGAISEFSITAISQQVLSSASNRPGHFPQDARQDVAAWKSKQCASRRQAVEKKGMIPSLNSLRDRREPPSH